MAKNVVSDKNGDSLIPFFRSPLWDIIQFTILLAVLGWLAGRSASNIGYNWQWYSLGNLGQRFNPGRRHPISKPDETTQESKL